MGGDLSNTLRGLMGVKSQKIFFIVPLKLAFMREGQTLQNRFFWGDKSPISKSTSGQRYNSNLKRIYSLIATIIIAHNLLHIY